jgi:mono/diheme cytochrome c family protein
VGSVVVSATASSRLSRKFETHRLDQPLPSAADAEAVARGQHLVTARYGCTSCHGGNLAGGVMINDPPVGSVLGPNLTAGKGGRTAHYAMSDWDRIVRHGVKPDGTGALMPSEDFFKMSDAELSDIVAYVRALPAVDAEVAAPRLGPVGKVLLVLGKLPIAAEREQARATRHAAAPPDTADSVVFGAHLAAVCATCHRANFAGGKLPFGPPNWPAAANLTQHESGLGSWSYEDFERALTQGTSKDGHRLREPMAGITASAQAMLPTERRAIWTYLRSLTPVARND